MFSTERSHICTSGESVGRFCSVLGKTEIGIISHPFQNLEMQLQLNQWFSFGFKILGSVTIGSVSVTKPNDICMFSSI